MHKHTHTHTITSYIKLEEPVNIRHASASLFLSSMVLEGRTDTTAAKHTQRLENACWHTRKISARGDKMCTSIAVSACLLRVCETDFSFMVIGARARAYIAQHISPLPLLLLPPRTPPDRQQTKNNAAGRQAHKRSLNRLNAVCVLQCAHECRIVHTFTKDIYMPASMYKVHALC